ncbi:hypothetical protein EJ07DRAFT_160716 [Lizonia empirigonia]|nr:hypothetical protein EJ07DRAFT_160716 [Lizonia empirigonia]
MNQPGNYREPERRSERANPPKGAGMYQVEGRSLSDPSRKHQRCARHLSHERPIQLPPLSSQVAVRDRWHSVITPLTTPVTYAPQEEKTRAKSTRKRGLAGKIPWPKPNFRQSPPEDSPEGRKTRQVSRPKLRECSLHPPKQLWLSEQAYLKNILNKTSTKLL